MTLKRVYRKFRRISFKVQCQRTIRVENMADKHTYLLKFQQIYKKKKKIHRHPNNYVIRACLRYLYYAVICVSNRIDWRQNACSETAYCAENLLIRAQERSRVSRIARPVHRRFLRVFDDKGTGYPARSWHFPRENGAKNRLARVPREKSSSFLERRAPAGRKIAIRGEKSGARTTSVVRLLRVVVRTRCLLQTPRGRDDTVLYDIYCSSSTSGEKRFPGEKRAREIPSLSLSPRDGVWLEPNETCVVVGRRNATGSEYGIRVQGARPPRFGLDVSSTLRTDSTSRPNTDFRFIVMICRAFYKTVQRFSGNIPPRSVLRSVSSSVYRRVRGRMKSEVWNYIGWSRDVTA